MTMKSGRSEKSNWKNHGEGGELLICASTEVRSVADNGHFSANKRAGEGGWVGGRSRENDNV